MGGRCKMLVALMLATVALLSVPTSAECPNACSGNGACMAKDMCNCYKNYEGNDCLDRTCQFGYAHADTPKGDIDYDQVRNTAGWILKDSQQFPAETYEYFSPDAIASEAHFYMECSNKGLCDRTLGTCVCFDGYEGVACQRAACPNKCSGRGTCESISELGLKAPGTLVGNPDNVSPVTYDLWDSKVTYGCRCDPWYHGADCSLRSCKVGVDPMFLSVGTATYEAFVLHVYTTGTFTADTAGVPPDNYVRLRLFDYHGESYLTEAIPILNDVSDTVKADSNAAAVAATIKRIPNQTFRNVLCERIGKTNGDLDGYVIAARATSKGLSVICQFIDNPGRLRQLEVAAYGFKGITDPATKTYKVITVEEGFDKEWFTMQSDMTVTDIDVTLKILTVSKPGAATTEAITLFKLGSFIVVGALTAVDKITITYPIKHTLPSTVARFNTDPLSGFAVTELTVATGGVAVGATIVTVTADPGSFTGKTLFFENQFYKVVSVVAATSPNFDMTLDRAFTGNSFDGGANTILKAYKVTPPDKAYQYNYVSQCSGRGICDTQIGVCDCFKGYTNDNCDTQSILAL
ncbi:EGF-like domain [Phytophthora infestans]|uniref:EGF-like domain n=2 Tax=Phytophthora infestans TaxID=4787 RepID=A0A8S9US18_PHYIN|nr:EGF-like domain [Phytophthora infestans]